MLSEAVEFAGLLRRAGVSVSHSEVRDFLEALRLTGVGRDEFLWAMEATLIKREDQRGVLERLYELFWERKGAPFGGRERPAAGPAGAPRMDGELFRRRLQSLKDCIRNEKMRLKREAGGSFRGSCGGGAQGSGRPGSGAPGGDRTAQERFVSLILDGDREKMRLLVREALQAMPEAELDDPEFFRRVKILTGWAGGEELLRNMLESGAARDRREVEERLDLFGRVVAAERDRKTWEKDPRRVLDRLNVSGASFSSLDYAQAREIRRKLVMLGRRLAAKKGYRYAASSRGRVDLRRTAALAGRNGGVPVKLLLRDRKPDRPEIVILCDLSGSVASFSRFMLLLVCAMQDKFRRVRSFAFVDAVEEVTHLIGGWDAEKKIAEILRKTRIWQTGFSDYGSVWRQFENSFMEAVGDRTTLIILGDARNNYKPDGLDHFIRIAGKARRVIWLNPAPADEWNTGDSIIDRYRPYCGAVLECRNLEQLEKVVRHVFK
ncbi:MAG: VWA domain-containing protein [Peptococcaceae bacterium]|nr:VWA domain-containing protein [Peptococcaceae bacterium]